MAIIRPFVGYRPPQHLAAKIAAPPYDVINSEEARELAGGDPLSFLHVSKPEIDLDPAIDPYSPVVYETARANLKRFLDQGYFLPDPHPCLYAYRQIMGHHSQLGLMAAASVDDYDRDIIRKHEKTRQDKEDDRTRHTDAIDANSGPVFLAYRARASIDRLMAEAVQGVPDVDFAAPDGVRHTLWVIGDETLIGKLTGEFAAVERTYVADGHHRAKSASRVREWRRQANPAHTGREEYNFFMAVHFPDNQLRILDYNRLVRDLNGLSAAGFLDQVGEKFLAAETRVASPPRVHDFGLYLEGRWRRLTARPGTFDPADPTGCLDVSILQDNLLGPLLGIADPRTDKRIDFVGGIRGTQELERRVNSGHFAAAFAMHPTTMEQLMAIADHGMIMPPKSTWFEPKLRSGLVLHFLG